MADPVQSQNPRARKSLRDRLMARVGEPDAVSGCWPWLGGKEGKYGYGLFHIERGGRWTSTSAHRVAFEVFVGPIPDGWQADHLCRNPGCVNPKHLEPVTQQENLRRRREAKTHCIHGHAYTPENTRLLITKDGYDHRMCRTCEVKRWREKNVRRRKKS